MATRTHTQALYNNMFILIFLLIGRAACDWVEITQNHYRKEPPRQVNVNVNLDETTKAVVIYRNNSLLDKHWKKGVIDRVPSVANIRRVHVPSVKTPSMILEQKKIYRQASIYTNLPNGRYDSVTAKPNILSKYHEEEIPIDPGESVEVPYINGASTFERNSEAITFNNDHIANTNKLSRTESPNKAYITNVEKGNFNENIESSVKLTNLKYQDESKVDFNYEGETGVVNEQFVPKHSKLKDFSNIVKPIVQSLPINTPIIQKTESFINKPEIYFKDESRDTHSTQLKNNLKIDKNKESIEFRKSEAETKINSDGILNNAKGSTMKTLWKRIKVLTDSIYKSTSKSFKSKIDYLEGLKSNILSSIEYQIERTWPDDNVRSFRRARDTAGRGHVEFPSSESALMSISFLTFAVFLIKLVLQVIHTYKNKTMMVTPAVVTAVGRAAAAMKSKT